MALDARRHRSRAHFAALKTMLMPARSRGGRFLRTASRWQSPAGRPLAAAGLSRDTAWAMSEENVEVFLEWLGAINRMDIPGALRLMDAEAQFDPDSAHRFAGELHRTERIEARFEESLSTSMP